MPGSTTTRGATRPARSSIYLGRGPQTMPAGGQRLLGARARNAIELKHAVAAIGPAAGGFGRGGGAGRGGAAAAPHRPRRRLPRRRQLPHRRQLRRHLPAQRRRPHSITGGMPATGSPRRRRNRRLAADAAASPPASATSRPCSGSTTRSRRRSPRRDEFFEFLFSAAGQNYADIKAKADKQEALPPIALDASRSRSTSTPTTPSSRRA